MNRRDLLTLSASLALAQPFDAHQNETVGALTERIIPTTGAKAAIVNSHLDRLLHEGPAADRQRVLDGLAWLDGYAIRQHAKPFARCSEPQQVAGAGTGHQLGFKELNKGGRVPASFACKDADHG